MSPHLHALRSIWLAGAACALLAGTTVAHAQQYDNPTADSSQADASADQAPGRVARLADLSGQVQFQPAGENDWGSAELNRPMVIGDRLLTGDDGRAVLELGDASVRLDHDSAFDFLNLAEDNVQVELSQGTLNAAVRQLGHGENFEVDTPTVAFVATAPGIYRIDDDPSGTGSMVTVFQGSGTVYGENGVSRQVVAGSSYRFNDSSLASVDVTGVPAPDDFDRFCETRDADHSRYAGQQQQYVPPDMIGADELDQYGQWDAVPEYGNVWYPSAVPAGWAPYRDGRWVWVDPWGWTWVDNAPWGFAPFHYGRWAYIGNRWGWMPGPVNVRPAYAPAMVAFIGGSGLSVGISVGGGGPVGWFPLGPRDVYVPWFSASRGYFNRVNVTNIRNVFVNRTVINNYYADYRAGRQPVVGRNEYRYRSMPGAVTAVPRNVFANARPVHGAAIRLTSTQLARTRIAARPGVNPVAASLGVQRATRRVATKGREPFARPVVARHQPPPRPVEFAAREKTIAGQHGRPLTATQMQDLRKARPAAGSRNQRVKLVPATAVAGGAATRAAASRQGTTPSRPAEPVVRRGEPSRTVGSPRAAEPPARRVGPAEPPFRNTVHPIQVPVNRSNQAPARSGELPSARFAHPREPAATVPRAPVVRPATEAPRSTAEPGRLPVVRPVERAPQSASGAAQRAREQQTGQREPAQQRARAEQTRRQEQQRVRAEQAQQASSARAAQQQQLRQQQVRQQRDADMQAQQRQREQSAQQQMRAMQAQQQQRAAQVQERQRATDMQRQQQMLRNQAAHRAPPPRAQPTNQRHEPPPRKSHPPGSSGRQPG